MSIMSCADCKLSRAFCAKSWTPVNSDGGINVTICGKRLYMSSNGANPVVLFTLELIVNSVIGIFNVQSCWSGHIVALSIWMTLCIIHSVCPSVCGWNAVDNFSFTPNSWCSSIQNKDMNLESQSETINVGSPCSHTMWFMNSFASSMVFIVVLIGTKCTCNVKQHITTQR